MQATFGGAVAVVLFGIYLYLVRVAHLVVSCTTTSGCTRYPAGLFDVVMAQALAIVGGFVSALVLRGAAFVPARNRISTPR